MPAVATDLAVELLEDRPGLLARAAESIASGGLNLDGFAEVEGRLHILTRDPGRHGSPSRPRECGSAPRSRSWSCRWRTARASRRGSSAPSPRGMNVHYTYIASGNRVVIATEDPQKTLELLS